MPGKSVGDSRMTASPQRCTPAWEGGDLLKLHHKDFLETNLSSECSLDSLKIPCSWGQQGEEGFKTFKTSVREC